METTLSIGQLSARTGVPASALRFYEARGLMAPARTSSGHRRYPRHVLRRVSFIRVAQQVGLTLKEIRAALATLPRRRTPTKSDWTRLARAWQPRLDAQIATLERLRERLTGCIGCGCLSLKVCRLMNPDDRAALTGTGPRRVLADFTP